MSTLGALLHSRKRPTSTRRLSDREQYILWAAIHANGEIFTFTGVDHVPSGSIIKIGPYSSEKLRTRAEVMLDLAALEQLESLGLIERVSKSKLIATKRGRTEIEMYSR